MSLSPSKSTPNEPSELFQGFADKVADSASSGHWNNSTAAAAAATIAAAGAGINTAKMFASRQWTPAPDDDQSGSSSPPTSSSTSAFSALFDDKQTCEQDSSLQEELLVKSQSAFAQKIVEWESRLSTSSLAGDHSITLLPRAYVLRINRLSCANPLALRSFAGTADTVEQSEPVNLSKPSESNPDLEYLMTSDEDEDFSTMSNGDGLVKDAEQANNANSSGNSCFKYRLKRPRLQYIEEEVANLNIDKDSDSGAETAATAISSEKEKTIKSKLKKISVLVDPFELLPRKVEEREGQPKCSVESASVTAFISAIKHLLTKEPTQTTSDSASEKPVAILKMCLPLLKVVSFETNSAQNSFDELQDLSLNKLTMDSSNSDSSSPVDELATTSAIGKAIANEERKLLVSSAQKPGSQLQNGSTKRVSFLEPDKVASNGEDQVNPFDSTGRFKHFAAPFMSKGERSSRLQTFASANKVQERLELQRAIMEDIEAANKTAKTASSSAGINQDEELASDGSTFAANNPRTMSSFLRPSSSVLASTRKTTASSSSSSSTSSEISSLLQQQEEELSNTLSKSRKEKEKSENQLSFLERAKLQAARQPCHSLPPVSSFVGTLGGKNFELEDSNSNSNSNSGSGAFSFLRGSGPAGTPSKAGSAISSSFLAGIIKEETAAATAATNAATSAFGSATTASFNPNSPLTALASKSAAGSALSPAELEARSHRINRFFSKLAAEGESRADAQKLAAASTLSMLSTKNSAPQNDKTEKEKDDLTDKNTEKEQGDSELAESAAKSKAANNEASPEGAQPPPYNPFTKFVETSADASNSTQASTLEKRVSGKTPMKRSFFQSDHSSSASTGHISFSDQSSPGLGPPGLSHHSYSRKSRGSPPPIYLEEEDDEDATLKMVLKMSAQEAAFTKVSKKQAHSSNKVPKTSSEQHSVSEGSDLHSNDKDEDIEEVDVCNDDEHWRNVPSTSGTQKVKPATSDPIPVYLTSTSYSQHRTIMDNSSSSSSPSAMGSYHHHHHQQPRSINVVGQKRKREVTFIEMIKEGGRKSPPLRPLSSASNGEGSNGEDVMILDEENEEVHILEEDLPHRQSKHQATESLQSRMRLSKLPLNPPAYSPDMIPFDHYPNRVMLGSPPSSAAATTTTTTEVEDILIDSDDEIIVPIVPRNSHPDRKMVKARTKHGRSSTPILPVLGEEDHQNQEDEIEVDEDEEISMFHSSPSHIRTRKSQGSSSSSSPWTTSSGGRSCGFSTYNIGATQQWDLNDRYWERFSATFVTSCAEDVPEAVAVDICEALSLWKQPKAFELQAKRRYTVLLRRGPLKSATSKETESGDKSKCKSGNQKATQRTHERFRIVIGLDFYNATSAERRHAIENWKFLKQENVFGDDEIENNSENASLRLFDVLPNGNTHSIDYFEFNEEDQQHSCFWSPEAGFKGDQSELDYDPDCSSASTSFDLEFYCLTEHFVDFMEMAESPMRLTIKIEKLLNTTKLPVLGNSNAKAALIRTEVIASDRSQRFEYAKVAKLSCGVRISKFEEKSEKLENEPSDTNPDTNAKK